jgi:serine/threonine-protein kinase RsbW
VIAISLRPSGRRWGTVSFASTLHLCPVLDLLLVDVPDRCRTDVRLGLQEALVNAAKHGNKLDPNKTVLVEFFIVEGQHWWIVSDQGSGFSPACCCAINHEPHPDREVGECGRGLYILNQVFDQVLWNQQGTELRLCKEVRNRSRLSLSGRR